MQNRVEVADEEEEECKAGEVCGPPTPQQAPPSMPPSSVAAVSRDAEAVLTPRMSPLTPSRMGNHRLAVRTLSSEIYSPLF